MSKNINKNQGKGLQNNKIQVNGCGLDEMAAKLYVLMRYVSVMHWKNPIGLFSEFFVEYYPNFQSMKHVDL